MNPTFSVIVPYFNGLKTIAETLNSILSQSFQDFEIIIIDDHSKLRGIEDIDEIKDRKIQLIRLDENAGPSAARNVGIRMAKGSIIAFLDADDVWSEHYLRIIDNVSKNCIDEHIFCSRGFAFRKNRLVRPLNNALGTYLKELIWSNSIGSPSGVAFRKEVFANNEFPENLRLFEDYVLYIQLGTQFRFRFIDNYFFYRIEGQNSSTNYNDDFHKYQVHLVRKVLNYRDLSKTNKAMVDSVINSIKYDNVISKLTGILKQILKSRQLRRKYLNYLIFLVRFLVKRKGLEKELYHMRSNR